MHVKNMKTKKNKKLYTKKKFTILTPMFLTKLDKKKKTL